MALFFGVVWRHFRFRCTEKIKNYLKVFFLIFASKFRKKIRTFLSVHQSRPVETVFPLGLLADPIEHHISSKQSETICFFVALALVWSDRFDISMLGSFCGTVT